MPTHIPADVREYYKAHKGEGDFDYKQLVRTSKMEGGREVVAYSLQEAPGAVKAFFSRICCCCRKGAPQTLRGRAAVDFLEGDLTRRAALKDKFKSAVGKVIHHGFGRGTSEIEERGCRGAIVQDEYWQEVLTDEHFGPYITTKVEKKWSRSKTTLPFSEWLSSRDGQAALQDEFRFLAAHWNLQKVDPETGRRIREVDIEKVKVRYLTPEERARYEVHFEKRDDKLILLDADGNARPAGTLAFVMAPDGKIYAGVHIVNHFHHSSFLKGNPVICAGEIEVNAAGEITRITNKSGHYKPNKDHIHDFLRMLDMKGVDFSPIGVHITHGPDMPTEDYSASEFYRSHTPSPVSPSRTSRSISPADSPRPLMASGSGRSVPAPLPRTADESPLGSAMRPLLHE